MARNDARVTGWWVFAAALLLLAGFLNIIWGISALLSLPAYPFWSLCIFALAIIILYELAKAPESSTTA